MPPPTGDKLDRDLITFTRAMVDAAKAKGYIHIDTNGDPHDKPHYWCFTTFHRDCIDSAIGGKTASYVLKDRMAVWIDEFIDSGGIGYPRDDRILYIYVCKELAPPPSLVPGITICMWTKLLL
jgi:hypothetical protein